MKILNATPEQKALIKEVLSEYPNEMLTVRVSSRAQGGYWRRSVREIMVGARNDLLDFS